MNGSNSIAETMWNFAQGATARKATGMDAPSNHITPTTFYAVLRQFTFSLISLNHRATMESARMIYRRVT